MKHFIVEETNVDERLDKFLTEKTEQNRSQIKKAILNGAVLVNDEPAKVHQFLRLQDKISIESEEDIAKKLQDKEDEKKTRLQKIKEKILKKPFPEELTPNVLAKTDDYIIIEKPPKLLVHETVSSVEKTLVDWLVMKFPEIKKIADPVALAKKDLTFRPGIVHRLDKEVSGLMLIARNQDAFEYYKELFKLRNIKKEYTAIVHGELEMDSGTIDFEISRQKGTGKMAAHPAGSGKGLASATEYTMVERNEKRSLVKINLLTGRTNQIRVHFNAVNHPIIGDQLYTQKKFERANSTADRLLLHANKLSFADRNGEEQTFESELPEEFVISNS